MAHASGPWTMADTDTRIAIKSGKRTVAYVQMARDDLDNARLIEAAPDLLEMVIVLSNAVKAHAHQSYLDAGGDGVVMRAHELVRRVREG